MTIEKVFRLFERIKPNALDMEQKLQFINEVEGKVQTDVMLLSPADVIVYDESMLTYTLLARPPHDKIYVAYLVAMTDYAIGEYNKYDTTIALYNDYMDEYKAWYAMTYRPADGEMKALGYYLSAYAIAVAHGFTGTEEQWLASLIGQRGLSDYDIAVRLGYEGTERDWVASLKGDKGDAFTYDDFTPEQLAALRGNPFTYEDFTPEQLAALQGDNVADAYELAVANGFVGTLEEWLLSLRDTTAVQPDVLGKPGGVATLDGGGTVPMSQVPILPIDRVAGLTAILSDAMGVSGRVMSGEYVGGGGEYVYELSGESHATDAYNATSPTATFVSKSPRVIEFPFEPDMVFIVEGNTIKKLLPGSSSAIRVAINIPASWGDGEVTTSAAAVQNVPRVVFTGSRLEFYSNVRFTGSFEHTDNQGVTSTIDASELDRRYYDQGSSTLPGQGTISSIPNASGTVYQFIAFEHAAPNDYKTYGVDIDQTDEDSDAAVSYTDDAVSIPAGNAVWDGCSLFESIKPCLIQDGEVVCYLDKNDYTKDIDGSDVLLDGSIGDVFVEIPKLGVKIETVNDVVKVRVTNDPDAGDRGYHYYAHTRVTEGDCDYLYLSVYPGAVIDGKLRSVSGVTPTASITMAQMREYAQASGEGYDIMSFYAFMLIECLFLLKYKTLDSVGIMGKGADVSGFVTGTLNDAGSDRGTPNAKGHFKLFGMEDIWCGYQLFIDGIRTKDYNAGTAYSDYNDDGEGYTYHGVCEVENSGGHMSEIQGTSELGFLLKAGNGSSSTYYRNTSAFNPAAWALTQRSMFTVWLSPNGNKASSARGARIMYLNARGDNV